MGDFSTTILGLAAIGVAGFLAYKFILPKLDLDFLGPGDSTEGEQEPYPVYVPSPPQTIIEERLVPVSQPPVYVYPPPVIGGGIPPFPCPVGRYWNGWECEKIDCPPGMQLDQDIGVCEPKCPNGMYFKSKENRCVFKSDPCDSDEYYDWGLGRCREKRHRDNDWDDGDRRRRTYNPPDRDSNGGRDWKKGTRPKTNITTLLTPKPKVEEEETDRDVPKNGRGDNEEEEKPKTSPVAALAGFTGRAYEYI